MALRNGSRLPVSMHDVFPDGCHLVPDSIIEAQGADLAITSAIDAHIEAARPGQHQAADHSPEMPPRSAILLPVVSVNRH